MRSDLLQKGTAVVITLSLVLLIIAVFAPSSPAVLLSPGTPDKTSVTVGATIIFENVNLTIRTDEAIPIDYLIFAIYQSNHTKIAHVNFTLHGTILHQNPINKFTVANVTNTSQIPYDYTWLHGLDEQEDEEITFNYGYGYGPSGSSDLSILYDITYKTHATGKFYAKLFVNCTTYEYVSGQSTEFTVETSYTPPPPSPPPEEPSLNDPPVANAGGPYKGTVNIPITFDGSNSTDDVAVVGYRWDWENDGVYDTDWSSSAFATHAYNATGVYTVRLQVRDGEDLTDTATSIVTINGNDINAPVAIADGPYKGLTYQNIRFDGSGSYGINAHIVNYTWAFGDGTIGYGQTPVYAYETAGTFLIILTVTDSNNLQSMDTTTAKILLDANRNNISDIMEETIGTPITESDLKLILINNNTYYLVDTDHDGTYDVFYNPTTNTKSDLGRENGNLLIDIDGDGIWDYLCDPVLGTTSPYEPSGEFLGLPVVCAVIIIISIIILGFIIWFYKTGRI